jgi:hypothetical protein
MDRIRGQCLNKALASFFHAVKNVASDLPGPIPQEYRRVPKSEVIRILRLQVLWLRREAATSAMNLLCSALTAVLAGWKYQSSGPRETMRGRGCQGTRD